MGEDAKVAAVFSLALLGFFALIGYGCTITTASTERLRLACIESGGVPVDQGGSFVCIRALPEQGARP